MAGARLLEQAGAGAYLGALPLIGNMDVLVAAGTIATIEARHQAILNIFNRGSPLPQAFDIALLPNEVLTIAGPLISGCDLGIQCGLSISDFLPVLFANFSFLAFTLSADTPLTVTNPGIITNGTLLQFTSPALNGSTSVSPT